MESRKATPAIQLSRRHRIYAARHGQIHLNQLAGAGGRPYIDRRLWRQPNETDLSWLGKTSGNQNLPETIEGIVGRKDRACCVNDAGRVMNKITQYLFKKEAERNGIDAEWAKDVTCRGDSINNFWMDVNERLTASQWAWIQVDTTAPVQVKGRSRKFTRQEKTDGGFRVVWRIWDALSVPDWRIGKDGKLDWIIIESLVYDNENPSVPASEYIVRTLFQRKGRKVFKSEFSSNEKLHCCQNEELEGWKEIPFILVGKLSEKGWWFDDIEMMQAQNMNLDSLHNENLSKGVFPQLVIPDSMLRALETRLVEIGGGTNGKPDYGIVREMVRGMEFPIVEAGEDKGIARFIQPNAGDLSPIPTERNTKRSLLFDIAGLALFNKESRQIQTAESKQFDHLDTASTLQNRALILQEAEEKLIGLSKTFDPDFKGYKPVWPQSFDVVDVPALLQLIAMLANCPDITPSMRKMVNVILISVMGEFYKFDDKVIKQAKDEIEAMDFSGAGDDLA